MDRAMEITLQEPSLHTEKPKNVYHQKTFMIGELLGKIGAGAVCGFFFDVATGFSLPLYNRRKNKKQMK